MIKTSSAVLLVKCKHILTNRQYWNPTPCSTTFGMGNNQYTIWDIPMLSCTASNGWVKVCGMLRASTPVYFSTALIRSTSACGWTNRIRCHASLLLKSSTRPILFATCWKIKKKQYWQWYNGKSKQNYQKQSYFCFANKKIYSIQKVRQNLASNIYSHIIYPMPASIWPQTAKNPSIKFEMGE